MTRLASCAGVVGITFLATLFASGSDAAEITPDPLVADQLPAQPGAHWVWVNDVVFHHMADGKAFLLDGDSGRMLGMLSTGFSFNGVVLGKSGSEILSPETYFSRGTRGERTDVVTFYANGGDFRQNQDPAIANIVGALSPTDHLAVLAFLRALNDPRVANETAPFDRPLLSTE